MAIITIVISYAIIKAFIENIISTHNYVLEHEINEIFKY